MKKILTLIFVTLLCSVCFSQPLDSERAEKWRKDIEIFEKQLAKTHVNMFHSMTRAQFNKYITDLKNNVGKWSENKIVTEITRIMGELKDGHSGVNFDLMDSTKGYTFKFFPLHFSQFDDGIFLLHAPVVYQEMIGKKLVAINNTSIDKVISMLTPLMAKDDDNIYAIKAGVTFNIVNAAYLNGLGITEDATTATFYVEDQNGKRSGVVVQSGILRNLLMAMFSSEPPNLPLFRQQLRKNYWVKYLPENKVLYIKYNVEQNDSKEPIPVFAKNIEKIIDSNEVAKTVIDIRDNQGGNIGTFPALIDMITKNPKINKKNGLFVLMNRKSQSAATVFINRLELNSHAILIGEPTLSRPNLYCNPVTITLPNTQLKVNISTAYLEESLDIDNRLYIEPHIQVSYKSADYFSNRDPLLETALSYTAPTGEKKNAKNFDPNVIGKYKYSGLRTAEIVKGSQGGLTLKVQDVNKDFINLPLYPQTTNSFSTDMAGFVVTFEPATKNLKFNYQGNEKKLIRLPGDQQTLMDIIKTKDINGFSSKLNSELVQLNANEKKQLESLVNSWGYSHVSNKEYDKAIQVFELNTKIFPDSGNAFDSLAEGYLLKGNKEEAIKLYKRSLELNPNNDNAKRKITEIDSAR